MLCPNASISMGIYLALIQPRKKKRLCNHENKSFKIYKMVPPCTFTFTLMPAYLQRHLSFAIIVALFILLASQMVS